MTRVLIFRPNYETATKYGHAWLGEIAKIAASLGHNVVDLAAGNATASNFVRMMNEFKPEIVIAMGHGNATKFSGQDSQIVLTACTNDQIMAGSQAYMLSCLMGQQLAPSMESKGALAVAAYISEFTWCINPMFSQDPYPIGDTYAKPFMTAVVEACRLLLRGGSWKDCYDLSIKLFNDGRSEWHDSPDPIASQIILCLEHDRDSLAIYGSQDISPVGGAIAGGSPMVPFIFGTIFLAISLI